MSRFRVGLMDSILAERPAVEAYSHASYLAAVVNRVDSYWVPDHINGRRRTLVGSEVHRRGTSVAIARRGDGGLDPVG